LNFDYSDDQQAIKSTAREFLASRFKLEKVRELAERGEYDDGIWNEIAELGWPGIFIEEASGGQDLGIVELAIVQEELGYACAPTPFFSNAAAGLLVKHAGSSEQHDRLLQGVASGDARGTVGTLADGAAPLVPDADSASFVVLLENGSASVHETAGAQVEPVDTIDSTRRYSRVTPGGDGEPLEGDVEGALQRIEVALAAELVGIAQRAMEMAVEYAKDRKQFDRPIGAYQGVSHRCAQMLLETESARAAMLYAGWAADNEPESLPLAASMAKAYAADAGWRVTASSLQVHGGIGFTWEHDLHWFLKRARADGALFGSAREHRDRVAELAGLSRSAAAAGAAS
jgi:alkylation response protein AidB-like acyl-CoA dehydrogenase